MPPSQHAYVQIETANRHDNQQSRGDKDRQQSMHIYAYADVNELNKDNSSSASPAGQNEGNEEEGWSENSVYAGSGSDANVKDRSSSATASTEQKDSNEDEGWSENIVYAGTESDANVSKQDVGKGGHKEEEEEEDTEGWKKNSIYEPGTVGVWVYRSMIGCKSLHFDIIKCLFTLLIMNVYSSHTRSNICIKHSTIQKRLIIIK